MSDPVSYQRRLPVLRLDGPPGKSFIIHPKTLSTTYLGKKKSEIYIYQQPIHGERKTIFYFRMNISNTRFVEEAGKMDGREGMRCFLVSLGG
jgi:hypothetical protein